MRVKTADGVAVFCAYDKIVKLEELKENPKNPNVHPENQIELLGQIITRQGWRNPITVSIRSGLIVRGHGRLIAAKKAGLTEAPVDFQFYENEEAEWADLIADNRISELSEIDKKLLNEILSDIDLDLLPENITGYTSAELNEIQSALQDIDSILNESEDEVPEVAPEPFSLPGDKWFLGNHILICGDSTCADTYKELLQNEKAAMIITDPPYNVDYEGKTGKIQNDKMENEKFYNFLLAAFGCMRESIKNGGAFYVWYADAENSNFRNAVINSGFLLKQTLIWVKNSFVLGRQDYQWRHEPCLYGWADNAPHFFIDDRKQSTVLEFDKPLKSDLHPTMKPVPLFERLIANSSIIGDIVLDPFGGSGTTLIACEKLNRRARLIELDARFVDVIVKRWEGMTGQSANCLRAGKMLKSNEIFCEVVENEN